MVTPQLQVEHMTGKVRWQKTDVLPLCHATNQWATPHLMHCRQAMRPNTEKCSEIRIRTASKAKVRQILTHDSNICSEMSNIFTV